MAYDIAALLKVVGASLDDAALAATWEKFSPHADAEDALDDTISAEDTERRKVREAIRTDGVLSAEIVVISLGTRFASCRRLAKAWST